MHPAKRLDLVYSSLFFIYYYLLLFSSINEQLHSSTSDREKNEKKTIYNKHQNTIDMQIIKRSLVCGLQNKL